MPIYIQQNFKQRDIKTQIQTEIQDLSSIYNSNVPKQICNRTHKESQIKTEMQRLFKIAADLMIQFESKQYRNVTVIP